MSALGKLGACLLGGGAVGGAGLVFSFEQSIKAAGTDADRVAHAVTQPWHHDSFTGSLDARALRRGYEVYKKVCSTCHGCFNVNFRMLANSAMTMEEAKAEAKRAKYIDGPGDDGEMFERNGTLVDYLPAPYPNDKAAAFANGGKAPPDLALILRARGSHGKNKYGQRAGENYVFALLTGYCDPPAGYKIDDGLHFNPYFKGGAIAMAPPLYNEVIEYSDGTPPTKSQLAKDVIEFLKFSSEMGQFDDRKKQFIKWNMLFWMILTSGMMITRRATVAAYTEQHVYTRPFRK